MKHKVMTFKDMIDAKTWSPEYHLRDEDKSPYIKKEGKFFPIDPKKSIPRNAVYLTSEQVEEYNNIAIKIAELQERQQEIIKK